MIAGHASVYAVAPIRAEHFIPNQENVVVIDWDAPEYQKKPDNLFGYDLSVMPLWLAKMADIFLSAAKWTVSNQFMLRGSIFDYEFLNRDAAADVVITDGKLSKSNELPPLVCGQSVLLKYVISDSDSGLVLDDKSTKSINIRIGDGSLPRGMELAMIGKACSSLKDSTMLIPANLANVKTSFRLRSSGKINAKILDCKSSHIAKSEDAPLMFDIISSAGPRALCGDLITFNARIINEDSLKSAANNSSFQLTGVLGNNWLPSSLQKSVTNMRTRGRRIVFFSSANSKELKESSLRIAAAINSALETNNVVPVEIWLERAVYYPLAQDIVSKMYGSIKSNDASGELQGE